MRMKTNKEKNSQDNPFEKGADDYDRWYDENSGTMKSELSAIACLFHKARAEYQLRSGRNALHGLEVGVGSGRFAAALGIETGIDPVLSMLDIASKRGINVFQGVAEALPFLDSTFDYTAFFTSICFLNDPLRSFLEARRVIKDGGFLLCSFLNRESAMGKYLEKNRRKDRFYTNATFYSGQEVIGFLEKAGFHQFYARETIFPDLEGEQQHQEGLGKGLYGVILAWKKPDGQKDL